MSIRPARILRGASSAHFVPLATAEPVPNTRVVPGAVFEAHSEASRLLDAAFAEAEAIRERARAEARESLPQLREEIRQDELAKLLAKYVALTHAPPHDDDLDKLVQLGQILAERLLEEELTLQPMKIRSFAQAVLGAARGHKAGVLSAHPADIAALSALVAELGLTSIRVEEDHELLRGSIHLRTDVGDLDGRIETQLSRFASAIREMLLKDTAVPSADSVSP